VVELPDLHLHHALHPPVEDVDIKTDDFELIAMEVVHHGVAHSNALVLRVEIDVGWDVELVEQGVGVAVVRQSVVVLQCVVVGQVQRPPLLLRNVAVPYLPQLTLHLHLPVPAIVCEHLRIRQVVNGNSPLFTISIKVFFKPRLGMNLKITGSSVSGQVSPTDFKKIMVSLALRLHPCTQLAIQQVDFIGSVGLSKSRLLFKVSTVSKSNYDISFIPHVVISD
jgi:hypothetical protein